MSFDSKVLQFIRLADDIMRERPLFEGKTFRSETVRIDFARYDNCRFENCTIILEWGISSISNCEFDGCRFEAKPNSPAGFVLQMDSMLRQAAELERKR